MINYKLTFAIIVLISAVQSVTSISCYQCNSMDTEDQFQCTEFVDTNEMELKPCTNVYNAAYCVKLTGRYDGGLGVKRYCSANDLGNYCNYLKQPGDSMEYRTCIYTCDTDGCNGSSRVKLFRHLIGISLFPLLRRLLL